VFAARYELNSYVVFRKRLVSRRLIIAKKEQSDIDAMLAGHDIVAEQSERAGNQEASVS
jgi:hypothetical protein